MFVTVYYYLLLLIAVCYYLLLPITIVITIVNSCCMDIRLYVLSVHLLLGLTRGFLENPMDGGAWWAAVHGVTKSETRLSDFTFTFHFHALDKETATHSSVPAWRIPGMRSLVGRTESDTTEVT